jgi:hypothetical protein
MVLRGARLFDVRCGDVEIWHGVAFLYRDAHWLTPEPIVDDVKSTTNTAGFSISIRGRFPAQSEIDYRIDVEGAEDGAIRFVAEATPRADVDANRLGICVMHPMSACGKAVEIEHTDGRLSRSTFPALIPPWPPLMLIRAIRHECAPGQWARCILNGDAFELEDQRNNADASFKTYSRSNMMPRPYPLRAHVPVRQSAELRLETRYSPRAITRERAIVVNAGGAVAPLPSVGVEIVNEDLRHATTPDIVRALQPAHLHLALDAGELDVDWNALRTLLAIGNAELRLDVELSNIADATTTFGTLHRALAQAAISPGRVAVFPSEQPCIDAARQAFPAAAIGGGTPHFFVQLNRAERIGRVDFLTFTTSSIVHGADDESVMLTLQSLPSMVQTLDATHGSGPVCVGPSGIGARRSPLGKQPVTDGNARVALARDDPRRRGRFGAAWTLGYVAQLATVPSVRAITLMSLTGPAGLSGCNGHVFRPHPPFRVLQRLRSAACVCTASVSDPARLAVLAVIRAGVRELLIANLTDQAVDVDVKGLSSPRLVETLVDEQTLAGGDGWTWQKANLQGALRLDAYDVAVVSADGADVAPA